MNDCGILRSVCTPIIYVSWLIFALCVYESLIHLNVVNVYREGPSFIQDVLKIVFEAFWYTVFTQLWLDACNSSRVVSALTQVKSCFDRCLCARLARFECVGIIVLSTRVLHEKMFLNISPLFLMYAISIYQPAPASSIVVCEDWFVQKCEDAYKSVSKMFVFVQHCKVDLCHVAGGDNRLDVHIFGRHDTHTNFCIRVIGGTDKTQGWTDVDQKFITSGNVTINQNENGRYVCVPQKTNEDLCRYDLFT